MALLGAMPFGFLLLLALNWPMPERLFSLASIFIVPPISAWLIWPQRRRTRFGMAVRGLVVVGLTITIISVTDTLMVIQSNEALGGDYRGVSGKASVILGGVVMAWVLGTISTLGLPWIIGAWVSTWFAESAS